MFHGGMFEDSQQTVSAGAIAGVETQDNPSLGSVAPAAVGMSVHIFGSVGPGESAGRRVSLVGSRETTSICFAILCDMLEGSRQTVSARALAMVETKDSAAGVMSVHTVASLAPNGYTSRGGRITIADSRGTSSIAPGAAIMSVHIVGSITPDEHIVGSITPLGSVAPATRLDTSNDASTADGNTDD